MRGPREARRGSWMFNTLATLFSYPIKQKAPHRMVRGLLLGNNE